MRLTTLSVTRLGAGLALLVGCNGSQPSDTGSPVTDTTVTTPLEQVMRDCPTDAGTICPYAGAGYAGRNPLEGTHRLDVWFSFPMSIAFPPAGTPGNPVLSDWNNHRLLEVLPTPEEGLRVVMGTEFLGDGDPYLLDRTEGAPGTSVALNHPTQQMYYSDGMLLSDSWHTHKFRTWNPDDGMVHVVLGSRPGMTTWDHDANPDTPAVPAEFDVDAAAVLMNQPKELWIDRNDEDIVYYVDMRNERIRVWDRAAGTVSTIAGETVDGADADTVPGSKGYCGEGDALLTCFSFPKNANPEPGGAIAVTSDSSTMYIADSEAHIIRVLDLTTGQIALLSGTPGTPGFKDGAAGQALWNYPADFALDEAAGALFVADANNHRIRKIDLASGEVSTVAGTGVPSCDVAPEDLLNPQVCSEQHSGGDGGPATEATLYRPFGVDLDQDGNLVIADTYDHRFRIVYR